MILQIAAGILLLAFAAVLLRSLWIRTGLSTRQTIASIAAAVLVAGLIILAATGRLNWIVAAAAAAVPFTRRLMALTRLVPVLNALFPGLRARMNQRNGSRPAPDPSLHTTTESPFFRMTLHHTTGHMDGEIKRGPNQGRFLSELRLSELIGLFGELSDYDSQRLLETYLDHHYPQWRAERSNEAGQPSTGMTRSEALEALALQEGASREEIVEAHRRLIQRLHPDRGGSTYLAALLNRAKDILLGK
jgi:hypothetical protein